MKWSGSSMFRWFFALIPRRCRQCEDWFWFEHGIKRRDRYEETRRYCADCAPYYWDGAEKCGKRLEGKQDG